MPGVVHGMMGKLASSRNADMCLHFDVTRGKSVSRNLRFSMACVEKSIVAAMP